MLDWVFANTAVPEICSWTARINLRAQRVITKLGLTRDAAGEFDHPRVPEGNPLRPHVLFRISRKAWPNARSDTAKNA